MRRPVAVPARRAAPPPLRLTAGTFLAHSQPGLEAVVMREIALRCAGARDLGRRLVPGRAGLTLFNVPSVAGMQSLRCAEDLFAVVGYIRGPVARPLDRIRALAREVPLIDAALAARVALTPGSRNGRRLRYRVVARMVGTYEFRRSEFQRAVERGIEERGDRAWRPADEYNDIEIWATLLDQELLLALRLTDDHLRQRDYKVAHIPGSLRPSVAAAMVLLSEPQDDDVVLDPFCGAATVLIERAMMARYGKLIGSDLDQHALEAARLNVGPRHQPLELNRWDAAAIPLPDRSVSRIVTNMPWGVQHGSHPENRRLYPRWLEEFARLVEPDGKVVMLTGEARLMSNLLRRGPLRLERATRVAILGANATIYECRP